MQKDMTRWGFNEFEGVECEFPWSFKIPHIQGEFVTNHLPTPFMGFTEAQNLWEGERNWERLPLIKLHQAWHCQRVEQKTTRQISTPPGDDRKSERNLLWELRQISVCHGRAEQEHTPHATSCTIVGHQPSTMGRAYQSVMFGDNWHNLFWARDASQRSLTCQSTTIHK